MLIDYGDALLATQRALLGVVTPQLRAVVIDVEPENEIFFISFFYDGEISEELQDLWECAITEASASLGPDYYTEQQIDRVDYPKPIPFRGRYAYLRKENRM